MKALLFSLITLTSLSAHSMDLDEVQEYLNEVDAGISAKDYCSDEDQRNKWPCDEALRLEQENKRLVASIKRGGQN